MRRSFALGFALFACACTPPSRTETMTSPFGPGDEGGGGGGDGSGGGGSSPDDAGTTFADVPDPTTTSTPPDSDDAPVLDGSSTSAGTTGAPGSTGAPDPTTSTSGDPGTGGATETTGLVGDTFNDGVMDVQVFVQSQWETGQCDDVIATNVSGDAVTWEIELPLLGAINQLWNANVVEADGMGTFTGVDFNMTLNPAQSAMFGYCVSF
jgi:endoglucanase